MYKSLNRMTAPQELRETPPREFHISPKTPYEHLKKMGGNLGVSNVRRKIAEDVVHNAQELEGEVDWQHLLRTLSVETTITRYTGINAVIHTIAPTMGAIAIKGTWNPRLLFI